MNNDKGIKNHNVEHRNTGTNKFTRVSYKS
jgi:hypothetical protein